MAARTGQEPSMASAGDPEFAGNAATFLQEGLGKRGSALLIASVPNVQLVTQRLSKWVAERPSRLLAIDAEQLLRQMTADGVPDELDFHRIMDGHIRKADVVPGGTIYVASEILALARSVTSTASASIVERLWAELPRRHGRCEFMVDFTQTMKIG
jgi:hypothetical protein